MNPCPVCHESETAPFIDAGLVPVQCTTLYARRADALAAPTGEMRLVLCHRCATVTNAAFEADRVGYDGDYENSQLFSPAFRTWAAALADRLIVGNGLQDAQVVEVGSGKGEFLAMLAEAGAGTATGYDPTYGGEVDHLDSSLDIHLVRSMFDERSVEVPPALVCARHVLEHVVDPVGMLSSIRAAVAGDPSCLLYIEVPNASFTFTPAGLWDIIYQHCSYFSADSLRWVAAAAGFDVCDLRSVFGDQFLSLEARPGTPASVPAPGGDLGRTIDELTRFVADYQDVVGQWKERTDSWRAAGRPVAMWGGGAKGVTFLNLVGGVDAVVDLNARKQGRFLPGTGHEVLAPSALEAFDPAVVIVMNAAYEGEIRADLDGMGLHPEIARV